MDDMHQHKAEGHLKISGDAIEKIARLAALEVEGVAKVRLPACPANSLKGMVSSARPAQVEINNDVADVTLSVVVNEGAILPEVCEKVQQNVKASIQNMTTIAVGRVNINVVGIAPGKEEAR